MDCNSAAQTQNKSIFGELPDWTTGLNVGNRYLSIRQLNVNNTVGERSDLIPGVPVDEQHEIEKLSALDPEGEDWRGDIEAAER